MRFLGDVIVDAEKAHADWNGEDQEEWPAIREELVEWETFLIPWSKAGGAGGDKAAGQLAQVRRLLGRTEGQAKPNDDVCSHYAGLARKAVDDWDGQCTADLVAAIYEATGEPSPVPSAAFRAMREFCEKYADVFVKNDRRIPHPYTHTLYAKCVYAKSLADAELGETE